MDSQWFQNGFNKDFKQRVIVTRIGLSRRFVLFDLLFVKFESNNACWQSHDLYIIFQKTGDFDKQNTVFDAQYR